MELTISQYYTECESIAKDAMEVAKEEERDLNEVLNEMIDNHEYTIYTYYNFRVVDISQNTNAYQDQIGGFGNFENFNAIVQVVARYAFLEDVRKYLE